MKHVRSMLEVHAEYLMASIAERHEQELMAALKEAAPFALVLMALLPRWTYPIIGNVYKITLIERKRADKPVDEFTISIRGKEVRSYEIVMPSRV